MSDSYDVVIVGAGPAGSALARLLAFEGVHVLLLDKANFPRDKTCGDALSPRALQVLRRMALFDAIHAEALEIRRVAFFSPNGQEITVTIPSHSGRPDFCLILPRYRFDDMLRLHALQAGADFRGQVRVVSLLHRDGQVVGVRAASPNGVADICARFTVLATGAATTLLAQARLAGRGFDLSLSARSYFEGVQGLSDLIEFHYDSVPLPGYGWVFPISATAANIGIGFQAKGRRTEARHSPRDVMERFLLTRSVSSRLVDARMNSPIKGYPIRFDFPMARLGYPRLLVVGEACGLVNPLSGEGIDYALESAELAAEVIVQAILETRSMQRPVEELYAMMLRNRFLDTFRSLVRVRDLYMREWMLNRYVSAARHNDELACLLVNIGLGNIDPLKALSFKQLLRIALG